MSPDRILQQLVVVEDAIHRLRELLQPPQQQALLGVFVDAPSFDHIVDTVARHYRMTRSDLVGRCRTDAVVWPRHVAFYLLRKYHPKAAESALAAVLRRSQKSAWYGSRKVADRIATDPRFAEQIQALETAIGHAL